VKQDKQKTKSAVDAGFRVEVEVYGVFTRALCEADRRRMDDYSVREKQGLVPDLQIDDPHLLQLLRFVEGARRAGARPIPCCTRRAEEKDA
jgi:hypothetical protein